MQRFKIVLLFVLLSLVPAYSAPLPVYQKLNRTMLCGTWIARNLKSTTPAVDIYGAQVNDYVHLYTLEIYEDQTWIDSMGASGTYTIDGSTVTLRIRELGNSRYLNDLKLNISPPFNAHYINGTMSEVHVHFTDTQWTQHIGQWNQYSQGHPNIKLRKIRKTNKRSGLLDTQFSSK